MLNTLFEFDIVELKKSAACAEIKFDTRKLIDPILDAVYQGIAGMRYSDLSVLSCTALSPECQIAEMEHDMFSGELIQVGYQDEARLEQLAALNDDTEIDDILMQACDPF